MSAEIEEIINELCSTGRLHIEKEALQHGQVSVYEHSVHVAEESVRIADSMRLNVDRRALIRGALLHDYFLYDWHVKTGRQRLHGFRHPYIALANAREDFNLTPIEENIILRHMFPLVPIPPMCIEAWIVCMADKYCAFYETIGQFTSLSKV